MTHKDSIEEADHLRGLLAKLQAENIRLRVEADGLWDQNHRIRQQRNAIKAVHNAVVARLYARWDSPDLQRYELRGVDLRHDLLDIIELTQGLSLGEAD
jgi:hypothetical protein